MKVKVAIVKAFGDDGIGGNPAGVVLEADTLSGEQKLNIAKEVGLSETAFVSSSDTADFKLDFFTPEKQIAHCGHATIATFSYLSQLNLIPNPNTSKETIDGNRNIELTGQTAYMEQLAPKYIESDIDVDRVLASVDLLQEETITPPMIANTGNSFLLLGVKSIEELKKIEPNHEIIAEISDKHDLIGFYLFTLETNKRNRDASTRMFAPRYGIDEESATGMAAGPLACYLHDFMNMKKDIYRIEQGYLMKRPSPSCIEVRLAKDNGLITSLNSGGTGTVDKIKYIEI